MKTGWLLLLFGKLLATPAALPDVEVVDGHPIRTVLPPDAIVALEDPRVVPAAGADFMRPDDLVIGVVVEGEARAYPLRHLDWHEVVNDSLAERPIAVTW